MDRNNKFEGIALVVLSLMLVSVFVLSINMYDDIATNTEEGALAVFAGTVRDFLDENDAIAAFFGFAENEIEAIESIDIAKEAAAYIERYNSIYADNK